ncbi:MAG: 2-polyprenyl-3-methyl-5-hydroxy-6-metoxy-1,4-benzoquinol methylase [Candidatus Azotimanducaceae bacterium]|jgi:2-polyprenyl-3-methyl-5-hydroxy-6-metoxy-1,4-benzoquinol methylase
MKKDIAENPSEYEQGQNFSKINSLLHARRYSVLMKLIKQFQSGRSETSPIRILDIGCGAAKVFSVLNPSFNIHYTGIDYKSRHATVATERYGNQSNFKYINDLVQNHFEDIHDYDVITCFETCEHIPEADVVRIIESIAKSRPKLFVCSVPNEQGPIISVKNFGSMLIGWRRHKEYSFAETIKASLYMQDSIPRHTTEHKGFDWRWLAQTIRHNMIIRKIHRSPGNFLPCFMSPSILFECISDKDKL